MTTSNRLAKTKDKTQLQKKTFNRTTTSFILLIFLLIAVLTSTFKYYHICKLTNIKYTEAQNLINTKTLSLMELNTKFVALKKQCEEFKKKTTDNNSNKKAIISYIQTNFKRIPIEVANSIANNLINLCVKHNVPYELIMGMIEVESDFNTSATSTKGARGLLQVMPKVWTEKLGLSSEFDLHQINVGLESGIRVLNIILSEQNGDMSKALYHYVGKDMKYVNNVYKAMGEFILHKELM